MAPTLTTVSTPILSRRLRDEGLSLLAITLFLGVLLLPRSLFPLTHIPNPARLTFSLDPASQQVTWMSPDLTPGARQGWLIRTPPPRTLIGIPTQTPQLRIEPSADFTQADRHIILASLEQVRDPNSPSGSPWHTAIPDLIAHGSTTPRTTPAYFIAMTILVLLGFGACLCFWKSFRTAVPAS